MRIRVRLFAIQRELAGSREVPLELPDGASVEDAWTAVAARHPVLAPGRASLRFARNGDYADPTTLLADGDEVAFIPPVSGGAGEDRGGDAVKGIGDAVAPPTRGAADVGAENADAADAGAADTGAASAASDARRILEIVEGPFARTILADLEDRLATREDGAVVGFIGRTRRSPGTPAPGQEAEAARHAGRSVESLGYEAHETMAIRVLGAIADEIADRFAVVRLAIVHRTGEVPLGEASIAVVAVAPHRDAAFRAARYAIDETKARAPIWKAERFVDGHVWIGEPARDRPSDR